MEWFNMGQMTKAMIVARLSEIEDPLIAAVDITEKTLIVILKDVDKLQPGHRQTVVAICQGTIVGLVLTEHSLSRGAVEILDRVRLVALKYNLNPEELMTLALTGIADVGRFATKEQINGIEVALELKYMGTGRIFKAYVGLAEQSTTNPQEARA